MTQFTKLNGNVFTIPDVGDEFWGQNVTDYLLALGAGTGATNGGVLQKGTGGTTQQFTLLGNVDFGATYGLIVPFIISRTSNVASTGVVRLAKTDALVWRNNANSANLALAINGSDNLTFNGTEVGRGTVTSVVAGAGLTGGTIINGGTIAVGLGTGLSATGTQLDVHVDGSSIIAGVGPAYPLLVNVDNVTITSGSGGVSLTTSGVTPGTYTNTNITVDVYGRITSATDGSGGTGSTIPAAYGTPGTAVTAPVAGTNSLTVGFNAKTSGQFQIAIGGNEDANGTASGAQVSSTYPGGITIGVLGTNTGGPGNVVIGYGASAASDISGGATAIGNGAKTEDSYGVALGVNSHSQGYQAIAVGANSYGSGQYAIALGFGAHAGSNGIAIGHNGSALTDEVVLGTMHFPISSGTNGQALTTDGTGQLSWTTLSTGTLNGTYNVSSYDTIDNPNFMYLYSPTLTVTNGVVTAIGTSVGTVHLTGMVRTAGNTIAVKAEDSSISVPGGTFGILVKEASYGGIYTTPSDGIAIKTGTDTGLWVDSGTLKVGLVQYGGLSYYAPVVGTNQIRVQNDGDSIIYDIPNGYLRVQTQSNGGLYLGTGTGIALKLSNLTAGTALGSSDIFSVSQAGTTVRTTLGSIATFVGGSAGTGTVTNVATGTGLTGGPITGTGTISMGTSGVTAGTYGDSSNIPQIVVDALGRITSGTNVSVSIPSASVQLTGAVTGSGQTGTSIVTTMNSALDDLTDVVITTPTNAQVLKYNGTNWVNGSDTTGTGTVTSVATGTGLTGGPVTGTGTISMGTTGVTAGTYTAPTITVDALGRISTASSNTYGTGSVTSINGTGLNGVSVTGGPVTGSGTLTVTLGSITPTTINMNGSSGTADVQLTLNKVTSQTADFIQVKNGTTVLAKVDVNGTITGANLSGVNTGDQTLVLTGDVTAPSFTGTGTTTLATVNANTGTFGSPSIVPVITVNAKGLITAVGTAVTGTGSVTSVVAGTDLTGGAITNTGTINLTTTGVSAGTYGNSSNVSQIVVDAKGRVTSASNVAFSVGTGTVTSVAVSGANGIGVSGSPITGAGTIALTLGTITPQAINQSGNGSADIILTLNGAVSQSGDFIRAKNSGGTIKFNVDSTGLVSGSGLQSAGTLFVTGASTLSNVAMADLTVSGSSILSKNLVLGSNQGTGTVILKTYNGTGQTAAVFQAVGSDGVTLLAQITAAGTITAANLVGTNTGDQTITLSGDVTGTGTGVVVTTLGSVNTNNGTFSYVTVGTKGLVTAAGNMTVSGDMTGTASGSNVAITLGTSGVTAGTYGNGSQVAQIVVDAKGRLTSASNVTVSASGPAYIAGTGTAATGTAGGNLSIGSAVGVAGSAGAGSNQLLIGRNFTAGTSANIISIINNDSGTQALKTTQAPYTIVIGHAVSNTAGTQIQANGTAGIAIGYDAMAYDGQSNIAIGRYAYAGFSGQTTINSAIAIGGGTTGADGARADRACSIAIGYNANLNTANGLSSIAIGSSAQALGNSAIAIGAGAGNLGNTNISSISIGSGAQGNNTDAIAIGRATSAGGAGEIVIGRSGTSLSGGNAIVIGSNNLANANFSVTVLGANNADSNPCTFNWTPGQLSSQGDVKETKAMWYGTTAGTTATEIFLGGGGSRRFALGTNNAWAGVITVMARLTGTSGAGAFFVPRQIMIERNAGGNAALVGTVQNVGADQIDTGLLTSTVAFTADTTNQSLKVSVTSSTASTVRWVAYADGAWLSY